MANEIIVYNKWLKYTGILQDRGYKSTNEEKLTDDKKYLCIKIEKIVRDLNVDLDFFFQSIIRKKETKFYDLKYFTSLAAIKTCKTYKKELIFTQPDHIFNVQQLKQSYIYIFKLCVQNNFSNLKQYITLQDKLYNRFILDLKYNHVSLYTLYQFENFLYTIKKIDKELIEFILNDININVIDELYIKYLNSKKIKKINKRLYNELNEKIQNYEYDKQ